MLSRSHTQPIAVELDLVDPFLPVGNPLGRWGIFSPGDSHKARIKPTKGWGKGLPLRMEWRGGHARGGSPRSFCSFIESAALDQTPDTRRRRCQRQGAYRHQPNEPEPPLMSAARYFKISDDGQFLFIHRMLLSNQAPY